MEIEINRLYSHFKGKLYYVIDIGIHSETREEFVIYRAMYGDRKIYLRPKSMFLEEIDPSREDNLMEQKYRFEPYGGELDVK